MSPTGQPWSLAYPHAPTARPVWSTEDELLFVTSLGAWGAHRRARVPLLRRYLEACAHRQDWGQINEEQVQLRVERLLAEDEPELKD
jgi:hypothetical protein